MCERNPEGTEASGPLTTDLWQSVENSCGSEADR